MNPFNQKSSNSETDDSVELCRINNEPEATLIGNFLENDGITYMFDSFHSIPYNGLFQFNRGYAGVIRVKKSDLDRAKEVLKQYLSWLKTEAEDNSLTD